MPVDELPGPFTTSGLLNRLSVARHSRSVQAASVEGWLQEHEPHPRLWAGLVADGFVAAD